MHINPQSSALGIAVTLAAISVAGAQPLHRSETSAVRAEGHNTEIISRLEAIDTSSTGANTIEPGHTRLFRRDDEGVNSGNAGGGGSMRLNPGRCTIL
jgi:hypothetical protein